MLNSSNLMLSEQLVIELRSKFYTAQSITILSAYVTKPAIDFLFDSIPLGVNVEFVCRARPQDIITGACDITALKILHYSGVKCFISRDLHAKLYVIDNNIGYIGSANFTSNGLKLSGYGNIELSVQIELTSSDLILITQIRDDSIELTSKILSVLECYVEKTTHLETTEHPDWWEEILLVPSYNISQGLYVTDLPWCNPDSFCNSMESIEHDIDIFRYDQPESLKKTFKSSKIYQFIIQKLAYEDRQEVYFGTVTEWIHSALKDDTVPYRSELKDYISNLYAYIQHYASDSFLVDRPNYSQRLVLLKNE